MSRLLLLFSLAAAGLKLAQSKQTQIIVQLKSGGAAQSDADTVAAVAAQPSVSGVQVLSRSLNMYTMQVSQGNARQAAADLQKNPNVLFAEPDGPVFLSAAADHYHVRRLQYTSAQTRQASRAPPPPPPFPRDPLYQAGYQWGLQRVKAQLAWPRVSSAASVLACVIDTGVYWQHPDLRANLHPMDAKYMAANADDNGHGTHVAGVLGAVGNNGIGVAGTALKANILSCKAVNASGVGAISTVIRCIDTCRQHKAHVINLSVNTFSNSQALRAAVRQASLDGIVVVNSAGNNHFDIDVVPIYPAAYNFPGLVAVAATQKNNTLERRSNWGLKRVELAAPGLEILSTILPGYKSDNYNCGTTKLYCYEDGTSQAAPFVAGAAALAKAASRGRLTSVQITALLNATSDPYPTLKRKVVSGGIININRLILRVQRACPPTGPCKV